MDQNMNAPKEVVERFCKAFEKPSAWRTALNEFFTDDCVYENVGFSKTKGPTESATLMEGFETQAGAASLYIDMLSIAANGNTVLTERVDHMRTADGKTIMSIRVMGVFEIRGEKISAWRDYFDTAAFKQG